MKKLLLGLILSSALYGASYESGIINNSGDTIGRLSLQEGPNGLVLNLGLEGLSPGYHGMHIHSVGDISDHTLGFKMSKGHVDLRVKEHGFLNDDGYEEGDLPNLIVNSKGSANVEIFLPYVYLDDLLDTDGSTLVIHSHRDDHITQPIGGAGKRVAASLLISK